MEKAEEQKRLQEEMKRKNKGRKKQNIFVRIEFYLNSCKKDEKNQDYSKDFKTGYLSIFDMFGNLKLKKKIKKTNHPIDISSLSRTLYIKSLVKR